MVESALAGTVTFLFTDIVGSTRLWEQHPEPMKSVLARHDSVLRKAIVASHGRLIKTTGDGCQGAFETAASAVLAALAAQLALLAETWPEIQPQTLLVRMGVYTGEAEARAGDYFGSAVNRAARLMSVGHGGQVLISAATAELVRDQLSSGASLRDLGEHRLKDLVRPEHVFQLLHPALPASFPPLNSLDAFPNNLPVQITSFIGREQELGEIKGLLSSARPSGTQSRIVTLTGSGGTGKTRLSLQAAAEVLPSFSAGVWMVELATLSDPTQVLPAVAGVLDLSSVPGIPHLKLVTDYLRGKQLLLILDNCEHLINACAELANHLLRACPGLKVLATSREALGITGEVSYRVPSLSLPAQDSLTRAVLLTCEAAQLFVERATAVNPRFKLTQSNTPAVGQICRRLDGIPLALELAAARVKLFPAEQIAARLNDVFRLLTGGSRTALPRQQTLRALIDWSYDLLSEPERALLRRLSVFVGGWSFEAADAISTTLQEVCPDLDVMSLLEQLVNKSLVVMEEQGGEARYHMLETIRQYSNEKLSTAGEGHIIRNRHLDYFLMLSEQVEPGLRGNAAFELFERLALDQENIDAAIEWGVQDRVEDILTLIGNLIFFWVFKYDDYLRLQRRTTALLARLDQQPATGAVSSRYTRARSRGLATVGLLFMRQSAAPAALAAFRQAAELERQGGDKFWLALTLGFQAIFWYESGIDTNMHKAVEESLTLFRELGDQNWLPLVIRPLSVIESMHGNLARARLLRQEMRQYMDQADHPFFLPTFMGLGIHARFEGRFEDAQMYLLSAFKIARKLRTRSLEIMVQSELAHLARQQGDIQQAKTAYRDLIVTWKEIGQFAAVANQLECYAFIASMEHDPDRAIHLLGATEALRETIHVSMTENEQLEYDAVLNSLHGAVDADAFASAWAKGRAMDMEQAIAYAVTEATSDERT